MFKFIKHRPIISALVYFYNDNKKVGEKYPIVIIYFYMDKEYLSKEGLEKIKKELEFLKTEKRKEIAEKLKFAKSLGDLSENAEYKETLENQTLVEDKIEKLEDIVNRAVIIEKAGGSTVQLGSTVTLKKEGLPAGQAGNADGKIYKYNIVGQEEADISAGKLSNQSPIGSALMGKKKGDIISARTPGGEIKYAIIDIS